MPSKYAFWETFLFNTSSQGDTLQASCPFCDPDSEEKKFSVKLSTNQFRCVKCDEHGNQFTFMQMLHTEGSNDPGFLKTLAKNRGLQVSTLQTFGFTRIHTGDIVVPQYSIQGKITNLCRIVIVNQDDKPVEWDCQKPIPKGCKPRAWSAPNSGTNLFAPLTPTDSSQKNTITLDRPSTNLIWITEGAWDAPALYETLDEVADLSTDLPIGIPGVNTFNVKWLPLFHDKDVAVCFHNDHTKTLTNKTTNKTRTFNPADSGFEKVMEAFADSDLPPKKISRLKWHGSMSYDPKLPSGYDIRDMYKEHGAQETYQRINKMLVPVQLDSSSQEDSPEPLVEVIPTKSFKALCQAFEESLYFPPIFRDTLAITMAIIVSTRLKGEQLWFRIIGPPGSGKSTIAECVSASQEHAIASSIVTGFHSGYTEQRGKNKGKDSSLIPDMQNKCTVIKDADTILTSVARDRILGELRDIYDGTSRARHRNFKQSVYNNLRMTFLLCGTDILRDMDNVDKGARFLDCEIFCGSHDHYVKRAMQSQLEVLAADLKDSSQEDEDVHGGHMHRLKGVTVGFMKHLTDSIPTYRMPVVSEKATIRIESLAHLLAYVRAKVNRDTDAKHDPQIEVPSRVVKQLTKLAVCLCFVLGKSSVDDEVLRLVQKVIYDSGKGYTLDIVNYLGNSWMQDKTGLTKKQLESRTRLSYNGVGNYVDDLIRLKMITYTEVPNNSGSGGRNARVYQLTKEVYTLWLQATGNISHWRKSFEQHKTATFARR